jgi:hypothetical protein
MELNMSALTIPGWNAPSSASVTLWDCTASPSEAAKTYGDRWNKILK